MNPTLSPKGGREGWGTRESECVEQIDAEQKWKTVERLSLD
jgi:hypothetical protein